MAGFYSKNKVVKIGILDVLGIGSLGDEAIQQAMIQNIFKYYPNAKVYGFASNPEDTQERHGIQSFPINRIAGQDHWWLGNNPSSLIKEIFSRYQESNSSKNLILKKIRRIILGGFLELNASLRAYQSLRRLNLDLLILSGGGQLDDDYFGAWYEPYILFFWAVLARLCNVKFAIVSVGVGNIDARLSQFFIRSGLSLACYRSYRDETSKQYLKDILQFKKNDPTYPDLAHSLQLEYIQGLTNQDSPRTVAINPLYFIPGYWSGQDTSAHYDYLNKLADFITWLIQSNYKIIIFSSCVGENISITEQLETILKDKGINLSEENMVNTSTLTVDDLLVQLSLANVVIASRLHSVLLATLLSKPVIALSYHFKVDMLMQEMGQMSYCLRIHNFKVEELKEKFISINENHTEVRSKLRKNTKRCQNALDEQYSHLFQTLLHR
jgi:polysaccharide pyruvyl transferase WcaK-like protein